jgi:hypothetical protein
MQPQRYAMSAVVEPRVAVHVVSFVRRMIPHIMPKPGDVLHIPAATSSNELGIIGMVQ